MNSALLTALVTGGAVILSAVVTWLLGTKARKVEMDVKIVDAANDLLVNIRADLNDTREQLARTQAELEKVTARLAETEEELAASRAESAEVSETLQALRTDVAAILARAEGQHPIIEQIKEALHLPRN